MTSDLTDLDEYTEDEIVEEDDIPTEEDGEDLQLNEEDDKLPEEEDLEQPDLDSDKDDDKEEEEEPEKESFILKYRGQEIEVDSKDEMISLAQRGMDYTQKLQFMSQFKKEVNVIDSQSIDLDTLNLVAEVKNNQSREALIKLALSAGVDISYLDEDEAKDHKAKNYVEDGLETKDMLENMKADKSSYTSYEDALSLAPKGFADMVQSDPANMEMFYEHAKDGVATEAMKKAIVSNKGGDFTRSYLEAVNDLKAKNQLPKNLADKKSAKSKAKVEKKAQHKRDVANSVYEDMDDDEFEDYLNKLKSKNR